MGLSATVTTTTTTEVKLKPVLKTKLLKRLKLYAELRGQLQTIEAAMDKEKAEIRKLREEAGVETLKLDGFTCTNVPNLRTSLSKEKLIEMGVTTDMLEEATIQKPGRPYEKITCPGGKEHEVE